jgi:hypothetical protein
MFNKEHRLKWDKNILKFESSHIGGCKNLVYSYQVHKAILNMNNKDFVEKYMMWAEDGKYYVYFSFVPNDVEMKEVPPKTDRGRSIIGFDILERKDDKIVFSTYLQCDL